MVLIYKVVCYIEVFKVKRLCGDDDAKLESRFIL